MGFKLDFTDGNGRRVDSLAEAFEPAVTAMFNETFSKIERAIQAERCPVHDRRPTVTRRRKADRVVFEFEACCDEAKSRAEAAASRVLN